ncbi:MAG: vanadium-dependent haloperoxidase [Bacteroidetes bacterium]|nr:vanadium-dependent haloperoxidase [Bacteroidota bacterium]
MRWLFVFLVFITLTVRGQVQEKVLTDYLRPAVFSITMVMVHDVVNPPAASRYYTYIMLGAYDIVARHNPTLVKPGVLVRKFPETTADGANYDYRVAAIWSILETGRLMLPSGYRLEEEQKKFMQLLKKQKIPQAVIDKSLAAGKEATTRVINFSKGDNYGLLSARRRYNPLRKDSTWYPTPPAYIEAVEPNWRIIRPVLIDSCDQFPPQPLARFSTDTTSAFYALAKEVYIVSKDTGAKSMYERTIAGFWDCNPFAVTTSGHMMIGLKKISPGGHWMDITGIAAGVTRLDFDHTVLAQTLVAATLMDAFICCWDEKYKSNRIRPESYINRYIDPKWTPYLQTPPFPEYTSGHSVISTAAAEVLTYLFGPKLDYRDNSEELFDITPRTFHSFREAAEEAAISRLYGGIHYRDGVVNGQIMGRAIGEYIVKKLKSVGVNKLR